MSITLLYNGKRNENSSWDDVINALREIAKNDGSLRLYLEDAKNTGPQSLSIQAEDQYFMPMMGLADELPRVLVNEEARDQEEWISMLGYDVDPMSVTQDFDLIVRMVKEFYETGDVSRDLLK